jgi:hypothetical protein
VYVRSWPVRDPRRVELNVRNRGIAAIGGAKLNGSEGSIAAANDRIQ